MKQNIDNLNALENASAVSANLHQDKRYGKFYDDYADQLSGFSGIWTFCACAGHVFTEAEKGVEWDGGWIEAIDAYVDFILTESLKGGQNVQSVEFLAPLAKKAIEVGQKAHELPPAPTKPNGWCVVVEDEDQPEDGPPMFLTKDENKDGTLCAYDPGDYDNVRLFESREAAVAYIVGTKWGEKDNVWAGQIENGGRVQYAGDKPVVGPLAK